MRWGRPAILEARDVKAGGTSAIGALVRTPPFRGDVFCAAFEYAVGVAADDGFAQIRVYLVPLLGDRS